ncbi:MAG: LamG domain-containing protein, partial [Opitutae bacterium]|nr:LamG domain-containing protein [Opitutae bacterium]
TLVGFESNQTTWIAGKIGNAIQFDGVNDWGSIPYSLDANFTIALWLKSTDARGGTEFEWHRNNTLLTGPNDTYGMFLHQGKFSIWVSHNWLGRWRHFSNASINTGSWMHLGFSRSQVSGSTGLFTTYINGVKDTGPTSQNLIYSTGALLYLGKAITGAEYYLNGALDDLRIYDRTLSDAEVKALHDLGQ